MSVARRVAVSTIGLLCFLGGQGILAVAPALAQEIRSSEDLAVRANEAANAVESLRTGGEVTSRRRTTETDRPNRAEMLEMASSLLQEIAAEASRGADASETRDEMTRVARLLDYAYFAAVRAGERPDSTQIAALKDLLLELESYYSPTADEDQR